MTPRMIILGGIFAAAGVAACAPRPARDDAVAAPSADSLPDRAALPTWTHHPPADPAHAFYACGSAPSVLGEDWSVAWRNAFIDGAERLREELSGVLAGFLGEACRTDGRLSRILDEVLPAIEKDRSAWPDSERWYVLVRLATPLLADALAETAAGAPETATALRARFLAHLTTLTRTAQGRWVAAPADPQGTSPGNP